MLLSSLNWNLFGHEKKLLKVSMGPLRLQLLIYYLLKRIKTNIMENIMEKLNITEKDQYHLHTVLKACQDNFSVPTFWFFFLELLSKLVYRVFAGTISQILGPK